ANSAINNVNVRLQVAQTTLGRLSDIGHEVKSSALAPPSIGSSGGLGRLVVSAPTATSVAVAEDAVSPFGFKLAGATSTLTGASAATGRWPAVRYGNEPGRRNVCQHGHLVYRRGGLRSRPRNSDRESRSLHHRLLRHAGERTGHPLHGPERRCARGHDILTDR